MADRTADGEEPDGDEANGGPFAGSRLDRSVNAAHGQQADAGQREIERLQTDAADLEEAADESGPDRP